MKKFIGLCLMGFASQFVYAQAPLGDSGTYNLHKFAQHIGKETFVAKKEGDVYSYDIDFKFTDRGSPVPLKSVLKITTAFQPRMLVLNGRTSRMSQISDSVVITGSQVSISVDDSLYKKDLTKNSFPVGGYSPGLVQTALLRFWKHQGKPSTIDLLPTGKVQIRLDGKDEVSLDGQKMSWDRYVVSGLIWGNELIWLDKDEKLACLITNDAEGDKLEMMQDKYEQLLPEMIGRAAKYGMQLFVSSLGKQSLDFKKVRIISGATVPDLENGSIQKNMTVVMQNGNIISVTEGAPAKIPAGAELTQANGKFLLPGLWDMHAHFQQAEWGPAYLASGVTTVRDCGNEFDYINSVKKVIDDGQGVGPTIIKAGIVDGGGKMALGVIRATNAEEAKKAVQLYKDNGFEQIKIYSSVTPAVVKAICDEAHRVGLTVTGHIPEGMKTDQGIDSGMNMINHITYIYSMVRKDGSGNVVWSDTADAFFKKLAEKKIVVDPTLGIYELIFRSVDDDVKIIEPAYNSLPEPLQVLFKSLGMDSARARLFRPRLEGLKLMVKKLKEYNVTFVAGTDMGFPGYSVARELEIYVELGLSPLEAIRTGTTIPARVMNKEKQYGAIKPGMKADVILIDGNPLENIRDIRKVVTVWKSGIPYQPKTLRKLAGFVN